MGGLYGSPRILQTIAEENVIPVIKVLGQGVSHSPNYRLKDNGLTLTIKIPCKMTMAVIDYGISNGIDDNGRCRDESCRELGYGKSFC